MPEPVIPNELETDILAVYRGPLEEFVSRRHALVKQLRAAKQRESADHVKALRKPSRMAWVLDNIVHEDPASIEQLAAAINAAQSGADLRTALETVKAVVRDVASVGARVAIRGKQPVEVNAIITAVHAVIGDAGAFADWRAGRLVEVPEAGGLDMLAAFTPREQSNRAPSSLIAPASPQAAKTEPRAEAAAQDDAAKAARADALAKAARVDALAKAARVDALAKAARADLRHAEMSLATVREQSERATQSVLNGEERLDVAERTLLRAQAEAQTRRADLEGARRDAEAAAAAVRDAERAVAAARARLVEGSEADE